MQKLILPERDGHSMPPSIAGLAIIMVGLELIFTAGSSGLFDGSDTAEWRKTAILDYGFFGPILEYQIANGVLFARETMRLVTFPLIHLSFTHMLISVVLLLALGKLVGQFLSDVAIVGVFFLSAALGAAAFGTVLGSDVPLVGSLTGLFGLLGTLAAMTVPRPKSTLFKVATVVPGALVFVAVVSNLVFGSLAAWPADVAAYLVGIALWYALWSYWKFISPYR